MASGHGFFHAGPAATLASMMPARHGICPRAPGAYAVASGQPQDTCAGHAFGAGLEQRHQPAAAERMDRNRGPALGRVYALSDCASVGNCAKPADRLQASSRAMFPPAPAADPPHAPVPGSRRTTAAWTRAAPSRPLFHSICSPEGCSRKPALTGPGRVAGSKTPACRPPRVAEPPAPARHCLAGCRRLPGLHHSRGHEKAPPVARRGRGRNAEQVSR